MGDKKLHDRDVLHRSITDALALADRLDLPLVAIHLDEARLLLSRPPVPIVATIGAPPLA